MVFCMTRKIAEETALMLATWWTKSRTHSRIWDGPQKPLKLKDVRLNAAVLAGVAFHHAGLDSHDRMAIETGYLSGDINVICCTSTLAVGVNLPCHLVIIKNTVSWQGSGCVEYSDLEIMQMLGRAGRPQFDTSASAVILTRLEKVARYERMVSGTELLESRLHLNLAEHLVSSTSSVLLCHWADSQVERGDRSRHHHGCILRKSMVAQHLSSCPDPQEAGSLQA